MSPATLIQNVRRWTVEKSSGQELRVARGAAGMFLLKIGYSALGFALGIVLARTMGAAGFGSYTYALSWATFLGVPAVLGFDKYVVRQVAVDRDREDWPHYHGLLHVANRTALIASFALIVAGGALASVVVRTDRGVMLPTLLVGLAMVPILSLMKIRQAALSGLREVIRGQWPELLARPLILCIVLLAAWYLLGHVLSSFVAMSLTVLTSASTLLLGAVLLHRSVPREVRHVPGERVALPWKTSLLPLVVMGTVQILQSQTDTLMLGALNGPKSVGIYAAASRGAQLVTFFLSAAVLSFGPVVASLHAAGDREQLQRLCIRTARGTLLLSLPVAIVLIFFGKWYLMLFGPEFPAGALPLAILAFGQLVNVACGAVAVVMTMTGYEKDAAVAIAIAAVANIIGCAVLIPRYGREGAAASSCASMVLWNVVMVAQVRQRLGIRVTVFG